MAKACSAALSAASAYRLCIENALKNSCRPFTFVLRFVGRQRNAAEHCLHAVCDMADAFFVLPTCSCCSPYCAAGSQAATSILKALGVVDTLHVSLLSVHVTSCRYEQ